VHVLAEQVAPVAVHELVGQQASPSAPHPPQLPWLQAFAFGHEDP
jgi:hypothetical protein